MYNYLEEIESIKLTLKENGYPEISKEIVELQLSGGTAGERFIAVVFFLRTKLKDMPAIYSLVKDKSDKLIDYARELNYL